MPTYRLILEYEGTRYHGWQVQQNARSVAGEVRRAIGGAGGAIVELGGAGRTDAGVHALAQNAHLRLRAPIDPEPFRRAVNDLLPADIHVLSILPAAATFHSRHDALGRSYLYQISTRRTAFAKKYVWWVRDRLDVAAMAGACERIVGGHDFAAFSERDPRRPEQPTIVVVESAEVATEEHLILFRITASHFLWKMVRRLVGALVEVGRGSASVEEFARLVQSPGAPSKLDPAKCTAPPSGLFLERIDYD